MPTWTLVAYDDPSLRELIAEVQEEYVERYGGPDATPIDPAEFAPPDGAFLLGWIDDQPVACGAYRRHDQQTAEIKRMYVRRAWRRRGIARQLLTELERSARAASYTQVVLETGLASPEAMALYETAGWTLIASYGYYRCAPESRCYAKGLTEAL